MGRPIGHSGPLCRINQTIIRNHVCNVTIVTMFVARKHFVTGDILNQVTDFVTRQALVAACL